MCTLVVLSYFIVLFFNMNVVTKYTIYYYVFFVILLSVITFIFSNTMITNLQ